MSLTVLTLIPNPRYAYIADQDLTLRLHSRNLSLEEDTQAPYSGLHRIAHRLMHIDNTGRLRKE